MAAVLNFVIMDSVARLELYEDDSLEAWFLDGSKISITACGNSFMREEKARNMPDPFGHLPVRKTSEIHQLTAYTGRDYRDRIHTLLSFRNTFAVIPFLPETLFSHEAVESERVIDYVAWPSSLNQAIHQNLIKANPNGDVCLHSRDGCAWAELAGHGQTLTTCYLARISENNITLSTDISEETLSEAKNCRTNKYVWRRQLHSIVEPSHDWEHPLSLLVQYQSHDNHTTNPDGEDESVASVPLPSSLPHSCSNLHLHLTQNQLCRRIKALYTEGILYRVLIEGLPHAVVEALPNKSMIFRSHDPDGRFFHCWSQNKESSGRGLQSMYCIDHTPCSVGLHPFSTARVINQASRLLNQVKKIETGVQSPCWKPSTQSHASTSIPHYTTPSQRPVRVSTTDSGHINSSQSVTERHHSYKTTEYNELSQRIVLAELSKIKRFNAITSHKISEIWQKENSKCGKLGSYGQIQMPSFVKDTLERTGAILKDIDSLLTEKIDS